MSRPDDAVGRWTALLEALAARAALLEQAVRDTEDPVGRTGEVPDLELPPLTEPLPPALRAHAEALLDRLQATEAGMATAKVAVGRELAMLARVRGDRTASPVYVDSTL